MMGMSGVEGGGGGRGMEGSTGRIEGWDWLVLVKQSCERFIDTCNGTEARSQGMKRVKSNV